jgi:8-oxo-dGTP pyrophosphatase MutT (NUDIX family)
MTTWQTYEWSKHEVEHYDELQGERAYGLIIFSDDRRVFMVQNHEKMWGFPKGHREDKETGIQAAIRETLEETGLEIQSYELFGNVSMSHNISYPEDKLNKHIEQQIVRHEKPHWNKPGPHLKSLVCYVIRASGCMKTAIPGEVLAAGWYPIGDARTMIPRSSSNQLPLLEDAIKIMC